MTHESTHIYKKVEIYTYMWSLCANGSFMIARFVAQRLSNIFFSSVYLLDFCGMLYIIFGITTPLNLEYLFHQWLNLGSQKVEPILIDTGAAPLCWTLWLTRNEFIFNKCKAKTFMQVEYILVVTMGTITAQSQPELETLS